MIRRSLRRTSARERSPPPSPAARPRSCRSSGRNSSLPGIWMQAEHGFFFFQAEDGIRDYKVTGVQTCALPISKGLLHSQQRVALALGQAQKGEGTQAIATAEAVVPTAARDGKSLYQIAVVYEIGRASCRGRV